MWTATDLQLYALTCDRFLPVVTGFPPSAREAGASVETMHDRFSRVDLLTTKRATTLAQNSPSMGRLPQPHEASSGEG